MGTSDPQPPLGEVRTCSRTGLRLRRAESQQIWRIAKISYGALNPPLRDMASSRSDWGRYDTPGGRTIYGASPAEASYAESLASQKVDRLLIATSMDELFDLDEQTSSDEWLIDVVRSEWATAHHMSPGTIAQGWREARLIHKMTLPLTGWFVEVEAAESISSITRGLRPVLVTAGVLSNETGREDMRLTTGELKGRNRSLTTEIAGWVRAQELDDGSRPHGIVYESKHSSGWACWAIWLRALDDGKEALAEPTKACDGQPISSPEHNDPLRRVASLFDLRVF